ncbi:hypothetical protein AB0H36_43260 [Kribbella sp. NPDC050820]|uniref:hypothetical protein n=1 Tax=Kribbella sp. NPDC050820 TaxID=3155408 RepID=UPI0033C4A435
MATTTLFPYPVLETDPTLRLSNPTVDGQPAPLSGRENRLDLSEVTDGWKEARINARVQVPVEELETMDVRQYEVVLTLHCGPTNLRATVALEPSGGEGSGQWTGSLVLPRMVIRDRGSIYATITGTVDDVPHRWLGRSREVSVDLHPPRIPEITGGQVPVIWRDFSKADEGQNPIDPSLHDEMSFVDMSLPEGPVIYLNERVPGLRRLLDMRTGRTRSERAVRETALDLVATPAIVSMANVALAAAGPSEDGGEAQWPDGDWQRDVLRSILPLMYPDREPDAALAAAVRALTSGEDAQDVQSRLLGAASRLVKVTQHVRAVIKTLEEEE